MSNYDDFLHFRKLFEKSKKLEDFPHPGPGEPFRSFHTCAQISSKWVNFYILVVLMSNYDDFLHFHKLFEKAKKIEDFPQPGPGDPFRSFHTCAQISSKWVNFYILVVLMSNYDDFLHFRKLFEKWKKLKISPTPALGTLFACFTLVPRFHPNEWILYILVVLMSNYDDFLHFCKLFENSKKLKISPTPGPGDPFRSFHTCAQIWSKWVNFYILVVLMSNYDDSFSQTFRKLEKIGRLPPPRPWGAFSLILHLCPDFIQMSEFLYLSCPDVKLWWFSSFSQTFRKIEKIEDLSHPGPGDPFRSFHTSAQISSKLVNFYILVVLMSNYDDFLHFCKLFENSKKLKISPTPALGTLFAHFILVPRFHPNECIFIS